MRYADAFVERLGPRVPRNRVAEEAASDQYLTSGIPDKGRDRYQTIDHVRVTRLTL